MQTTADIERRRLLELAREYRRLGYEVILEPQREQLPDFLTTFQPDMLVRNSVETVVVEVRSRESLARSPELEALATVIQQHAGWRFELVVTNPRDKSARIRVHNREDLLAAQDIVARLNEARDLARDEHGEASFLLAWSATEATLRRTRSQHRISAADSSSSIIKNLFAHGVINEAQYRELAGSLAVRDSLLHGQKAASITPARLHSLLTTTEQILSEQ